MRGANWRPSWGNLPGTQKPILEDIIGGLCAISLQFARFDWSLVWWGKYYIVRFPDPKELNHAICITSIPYCDHTTGFKVYRWSGEEDDKFHIFPMKACLSLTGLPLHHWNKTDLSKIVAKFAYLVDVEDETIWKTDIRVARILVSCDTDDAILWDLLWQRGGVSLRDRSTRHWSRSRSRSRRVASRVLGGSSECRSEGEGSDTTNFPCYDLPSRSLPSALDGISLGSMTPMRLRVRNWWENLSLKS